MQNLTTFDTNKFLPYSVGFDSLFDRLFDMDLDSSNSFFDGLSTYFPLIKPTLEAPTGPIKGIPDIANAAEEAIIDKISGSFSLS